MALLSVAVVAVVAFVVGFRRAAQERALPTYDATRPEYGRLVIAYDELDESGTPSAGTITADRELVNYDIDAVHDGEPLRVVSNAAGVHLLDDGVWYELEETSALLESVGRLAFLPLFEDYIPDEARRFTDVVEKQQVELNGREVTRLDLEVGFRQFRSAEPDAYEEWFARFGGVAGENPDEAQVLAMTLWVDGDGIVWRFDSRVPGEPAYGTYDVVSFDAAPFIASLPADAVLDAVPPVPSVPSPATERPAPAQPAPQVRLVVPCETQRHILETEVAEHISRTGVVPGSEADLGRADQPNFDIVGGQVVPVPGGECDE